MSGEQESATKEDRARGTIQAFDRGLMVLDALAAASGDASLAQLAAQFPWHKSTTLRLLKTLVQHGHAEQDPESQRYHLGLGILRLSCALDRRLDLRDRGRGPVRQLANRIRETAHIGVLDRGEVVVLEQAETSEHIRIITFVGMRMPIHCTALGKVLLAHLPEEELERYLQDAKLERYTDRTLVEVPGLRASLATVRDQGYAFDDQEYELGMSCLAAPISNRSGRVVASVGASGPTHRMQSQDFDEAVEAVTEAAHRISQALGCHPRS